MGILLLPILSTLFSNLNAYEECRFDLYPSHGIAASKRCLFSRLEMHSKRGICLFNYVLILFFDAFSCPLYSSFMFFSSPFSLGYFCFYIHHTYWLASSMVSLSLCLLLLLSGFLHLHLLLHLFYLFLNLFQDTGSLGLTHRHHGLSSMYCCALFAAAYCRTYHPPVALFAIYLSSIATVHSMSAHRFVLCASSSVLQPSRPKRNTIPLTLTVLSLCYTAYRLEGNIIPMATI